MIRALSKSPAHHIVNDVFGEVPISVAHCNRFQCTRAYVGNAKGRPLDIEQAGIGAGTMFIRVDGRLFHHRDGTPVEDDPQMPCKEYPYQLATWSDWRTAHPDTELYDLPN